MNISILCTDPNHPVIPELHQWILEISRKGHIASLFSSSAELVGGDFLFLVSCGERIGVDQRAKFQNTLVLHASDLPRGRGWSPHIWAILDGENKITVSLLEAAEPIDCGRIWLQRTFFLEGHELLDEINAKLFSAEMQLMTAAIEQLDLIVPSEQIGNPDFYRKKRTPIDSSIDPYKSIASQFSILRVADPERYPAFFEYQGMKYLLKIEKVKDG